MPNLSLQPLAVTVWTGDYGEYEIPRRFEGVATTLSGRLDRRFKHPLVDEFKAWLSEQEAAAKAALSKTDASGGNHGVGS